MKKLLNIFSIVLILIPSFISPVKVNAQTFGELKKELKKFEQDYQENKNKQQMTANEISSTKNTILDISVETENIGKEIVKELSKKSLKR